jgi:large subunit ribosomal protein L30
MPAKKKSEKKSSAMLRIKYVRSAIGCPVDHKLIIKSLGFKRLNQVVTRVDTAAIRGMVAQAPHLVTILDSK